MKLQYLTSQGIDYLKGAFDQNLPQYLAGNGAFFRTKLREQGFLQDTGYEIEPFANKMQVTDDDKADDVHNAIVLHRALRKLPKYMAIDERIWAALSHTILFDFICKKKADDFSTERKGYRKKIYNSFFTYTSNGKRRGLFVNCVSSLFFGADMVYDSQAKNPYYLLQEVASTGFPSTVILFSSSRILTHKETCVGFLKVVKELRAQGVAINRQDAVEAVKYLNLIAGMSIIDLKSKDEISTMVRHFYQRKLQLSA